jgi:hypothetical protein
MKHLTIFSFSPRPFDVKVIGQKYREELEKLKKHYYNLPGKPL